MASPNEYPLILYATVPREGHLQPALQICTDLVLRGFDVTLMATSTWEKAITQAGAHYAPMVGFYASLSDKAKETPPDVIESLMAMPRPSLLALVLSKNFAKMMVSGWDSVRNTLVEMKHRVGGIDVLTRRKIVVLSDTAFEGTLPLRLKTSSMPPGFDTVEIRSVGISVVPRWWATKFHPPWGSGLTYDISEVGISRNLRAHAEICEARLQTRAEEQVRNVLKKFYGCEKDVDSLFQGYQLETEGAGAHLQLHGLYDATSVSHDVTLQMGMESLEFPLPDKKCLPSHFKFAGPLPLKPVPSTTELPTWFDVIKENSAQLSSSTRRKRIAFVAQGTETRNYNELVIPTIQGLAACDDIVVVAVLCLRGATLDMPAHTTLPSNTHVIDYLHYDAVLAHADVFVSSSGFGGLTHAIANAVPLVQSGGVIDKPDIGRRVEFSGLGIYLENFPPKPEAVRDAVAEILSSSGQSYKKRALELQSEAREYQPLKMIEDEILHLVAPPA